MRRNSKIEDFANKTGFSYAKGIQAFPEYLLRKEFSLFWTPQIHKREILATNLKNILSGNIGNYRIFISDFKTDNGIYLKTNYKQTIAILRSNDFELPPFILTPRKTERFTVKLEHFALDSLGPGLKGFEHIDFPDYSRLQKKYTLKSKDPNDQRLMHRSFLEYLKARPGWFMEGNGDTLLVYRRGKLVKPSHLRDFVNDAVEIGKLLAS